MDVTHLCTVKRRHSGTYLPPLPEDPSWFKRFKRRFRTWTIVSSKHPKGIEYFKSATGLRRERKRHVGSQYVHIIHPFSLFRVYYEMYMCVVYFVVILLHTFVLEIELRLNQLSVLQEFASNLCVADMIITFFTGYAVEAKRDVVLEPRRIAFRYLCGMFVVDLLAFSPINYFIWTVGADLETDTSFSRVTEFIKMARLFRVYTMNRYMHNAAEYFGFHMKKTFKIIQLLVTIYIIVNIFGFLHFYLPQLRIVNKGKVSQRSWIRQAKLISNADNRYPDTLFRTTAFILGASKGMVDGAQWEELLLTIITLIFGKFLVMLITVLVLHMMMSSRTLQIKYEQITNQLEEYMKYKDLPLPMRKRLRLYYDYKYQKKFFRESVVSNVLSDGLKREIKMHVCRKLVANVTLFADMPANVVSNILEYLRSEVYLPNDSIIKAGDLGDSMYFLSSGTVAVYSPSGREICHLQDGAYFGEISLIMKDQFRTANVIAVEICEVYSLERKYFKKYFLNNQKLFQKLFQIAEDRLEMLVLVEDYYKKRVLKKS